jgi:chemotaxis protein MotB
MRSVKFPTVLVALGLCAGMALVSGCNSQMKDLENRNRIQQARIDQLTTDLSVANTQLEQLKRQLAAAQQTGGIEVETLQQRIAALEEDVAKKEELIKSMQAQLMGVSALPVEVSTALEDLARDSDMIEYDASRGIVKFKSDLLFELGSDDVTTSAAESVKKLCEILNRAAAKEFDIIVAGHTDDMRIARQQTKAEHPTNRHLSSHRAISVVQLMEANGIQSGRLSTRGFGEFRPIEPNAANQRGNAKNRRVEIYIVPKGA